MRVLVAPDSFKESMSARTAAEAIARGLRRVDPAVECALLPVADGGEGLLPALAAPLGLTIRRESVQGPLGVPNEAHWGWDAKSRTAVVEVAEAIGLHLVPPGQRDIFAADTYGVGQLLLAARAAGARRILVGLGGSATNDGGAGLLRALGARLLDGSGRERGSTPAELASVTAVAGFPIAAWEDCELLVASDVINPLTGPDGASNVFGPQKGASPADVVRLERILSRWGESLAEAAGSDHSKAPGAGAAGGLGAALLSLGATLRPGIQVVLEALDFQRELATAGLVITGEGRIDGQTAGGKAPWGVCQAATAAGVPTIAFCGKLGSGAQKLLGAGGFAAIVQISDPDEPIETALARGPENLAAAVEATVGPYLEPPAPS